MPSAVELAAAIVAANENLAALTTAGWEFEARLGTGLESWAEMVPHREWGGIRATWEEAAEDKYK